MTRSTGSAAAKSTQRYRPRPRRIAVVLLLSFTFCVSALIASGAFEESTDPSRASTRILTPEEAVQQAEQEAADRDSGSAPVALVALLLLVSGALLISLAVPTPAERRRSAAAQAAAGPAAVPGSPGPAPDGPTSRRRMPGAEPVPAFAPPRRPPNPDSVETRVIAGAPLVDLRMPATVAAFAPPPPAVAPSAPPLVAVATGGAPTVVEAPCGARFEVRALACPTHGGPGALRTPEPAGETVDSPVPIRRVGARMHHPSGSAHLQPVLHRS